MNGNRLCGVASTSFVPVNASTTSLVQHATPLVSLAPWRQTRTAEAVTPVAVAFTVDPAANVMLAWLGASAHAGLAPAAPATATPSRTATDRSCLVPSPFFDPLTVALQAAHRRYSCLPNCANPGIPPSSRL
jgi:hypothetical protein